MEKIKKLNAKKDTYVARGNLQPDRAHEAKEIQIPDYQVISSLPFHEGSAYSTIKGSSDVRITVHPIKLTSAMLHEMLCKQSPLLSGISSPQESMQVNSSEDSEEDIRKSHFRSKTLVLDSLSNEILGLFKRSGSHLSEALNFKSSNKDIDSLRY
jgi:hypothetical protein